MVIIKSSCTFLLIALTSAIASAQFKKLPRLLLSTTNSAQKQPLFSSLSTQQFPLNAIYRISMGIDDERGTLVHGSGTGFLIKHPNILKKFSFVTAAHNLRIGPHRLITPYNSPVEHTRFLIEDTQPILNTIADTALIPLSPSLLEKLFAHFNTHGLPTIPVGSTLKVRSGDICYIVGHSSAHQSIIPATIAGYVRLGEQQEVVEHEITHDVADQQYGLLAIDIELDDHAKLKGMSGCPVLTEEGTLLGVFARGKLCGDILHRRYIKAVVGTLVKNLVNLNGETS